MSAQNGASLESKATTAHHVQETVTKLSAHLNIDERFERLAKDLQKTLSQELRTVLSESDLLGHSTDMRSRNPTNEAKKDVEASLQSGDFESAFMKALKPKDLSLLHFLIERVNPKTIFSPTKSALSQPVILSLVHQLSLEPDKLLETKLAFIQEALLVLDTSVRFVASSLPHSVLVLTFISILSRTVLSPTTSIASSPSSKAGLKNCTQNWSKRTLITQLSET